MLKRAVAFGFLLVGLGLFASCSSSGKSASQGFETVQLKGTSTGGGNAITVIVSFGSFLRSAGVSWNRLGLDLARLEVPLAPGCALRETLTPESGAIHLDLLANGALRLKFYLPEGTQACAIGLVPAGQTPFTAQGTLDDGRLISIKSTPGTLYLLPKNGVFSFAPQAQEHWITGLDLQTFLPASLLAQLAQPATLARVMALRSEILVDAEHNSGYLAPLNENLAQSLRLINDGNRDGALSETEWRDAANTLGTGSAKAPSTGCSADANCGVGQVCANGVCQAADGGCVTDADCPANQLCDTTTRQCRTQSASCSSDSACATGQVCVNGVCQVVADGDQELPVVGSQCSGSGWVCDSPASGLRCDETRNQWVSEACPSAALDSCEMGFDGEGSGQCTSTGCIMDYRAPGSSCGNLTPPGYCNADHQCLGGASLLNTACDTPGKRYCIILSPNADPLTTAVYECGLNGTFAESSQPYGAKSGDCGTKELSCVVGGSGGSVAQLCPCGEGASCAATDGDGESAAACTTDADCPTGQVCYSNVCSVQ